MNESWIDELAGDPATLEPRPEFEARLRSQLSDEWNGVPTITPDREHDEATPTRTGWLLGAAAAAVLLVGGLVVVIARDSGDTVIAPGDTDDAPVTSSTPTVTDVTPETVVEAIPVEPEVTGPPSTELAPETTGPPPTTAPPTTAVPGVTTDDLLADWPVEPLQPASLDDVPRLLPAAPLPGAVRTLRSESVITDEQAAATSFEQIWYRPDGTGLIAITTRVGRTLPLPPEELRTPFEAPPWDESYFNASEGVVNLTLTDESGYVFLAGQDVSEDEMAAVARSLTRRSAGVAGWDVPALPDGFVLYQEGPETSRASRMLQWFDGTDAYVGEFSVRLGSPIVLRDAFPIFGDPVPETLVEDVDGMRVFAVEANPTRSIVVWSPGPGLTARFGYAGAVDEALDIVRSMSEVDQATWEAASEVNTSTDDGCQSFFC